MKKLLLFLFTVAVGCVIAYFLADFTPEHVYGWTGGLWHGTMCVYNYILSFIDGRAVIAPEHTAAYSWWFWIFAVLQIITTASSFLQAVFGLFRGHR